MVREGAWAAFFHLGGGAEDVQGALREGLFRYVGDDLGV